MADAKNNTRGRAPETPAEMTARLLAPFFGDRNGDALDPASPDGPKTGPSPATAARVQECA